MPYVTDHSDDPGVTQVSGNVRATGTETLVPVSVGGRTRDQYGWRSRGEVKASTEALAATQHSATWSDTTSVIAALDRVERAMSDPLIRNPADLPVHERTYREEETVGSRSEGTIYYSDGQKYMDVYSPVSARVYSSPSLPNDASIRGRGGDQLRASRPTSPASNLSQWFGELRQFGSGFSVPRDMPDELWNAPGLAGEVKRFRRGGQAVGSGYLAAQFGWIPFVGSVIEALDAVSRSEPIIDQYLRDSGRLVKRSRSETLFQDSRNVSGVVISNSRTIGKWSSSYVGFSPLDINVAVSWAPGFGSTSFRARANVTATRTRVQRSGGLWEYFAADPNKVLTRMHSYIQKANAILGDPLLSYSTLWELAPWSWLVDWRFDFGSLLSFQESVANDSLACRRSYTVLEDTISVHAIVTPELGSSSYFVGTPGNATYTLKRQRRLSGSPYDMGIDWSGFSPQQWFILGSLGLTKGPGIPK